MADGNKIYKSVFAWNLYGHFLEVIIKSTTTLFTSHNRNMRKNGWSLKIICALER